MAARLVLVIGQLQQGGAEGQLFHLARGLRATSYQPAVACLSEVAEPHASRLRAGGIPVTVFPRRRHRDLSRVRALAAFIRDGDTALVHSFLVGANAYAYAASLVARFPHLIVSSRTSMPAPGPAARFIHSWVFNHASAVVANSESVRAFTSAHYGVAAGRIRVVRNGVDVTAYREAAAAAPSIRREMGAEGPSLLVGTLGRLSREKNLELFVDMSAAIAREFPAARFVIIGDGPHRGKVESAVRQAGLAGRLTLAGDRADVPEILSALDVFVLTSDTEGLPNAVMEAMAAGLPVVATRVGGTHEVVADGETGYLVPPGQVVPLLGAMRRLLVDAELRRRLGETARARMTSEFSVERMIAGTVAVYDGVLAGAGREAA